MYKIIFVLLVAICLLVASERYVPEFTVKGYSDLLRDYKNIQKTPGGVPKIIIKTSWQKRTEFHHQLIEVLQRTIFMNPDYEVYYFDNDEVTAFMKSYSKEAFDAYKKISPGAFKADLFRYCVLEKYGGCYSDIGHVVHHPFNKICGRSKLVLVKDFYETTGLHNALICTGPGTTFMKNVVDACIQNITREYYGYDPLCITGPILFGKVYCAWLNKDTYVNYEDSVDKRLNEKLFKTYIKPGPRDTTMLSLKNLEGTNDVYDNFIVDANGTILIRSKFKNYYNVMYKDKRYYGDHWKNGAVYA
jgi:mannosyltransferase OCH1-like enzyme